MKSDPLGGSGGDWEQEDTDVPFTRDEPTPSRTRHHSGLILMAGITVAVLLAVVLGIGASLGWYTAAPPDALAASTASPVDSGDDTPLVTAPLALATAVPRPLGDATQSEKAASATVTELINASNEITQRGDGGTDGIGDLATGFVAGELESLALERSQQGYTQTGSARVTSVTTQSIDLTAMPPSITLAVCIDTSDIDVLDENGTSLKDRLYDPGVPTLHLYGAQFLDGLWKIATHEIPDNASCS